MDNWRARRRSDQVGHQPDAFERERMRNPPRGDRVSEAWERMEGADRVLYDRYRTGPGEDAASDDPVRLLLMHPVLLPAHSQRLYVMGLGEKVAALGGHLEVRAVFADASVTLITEPGAEGQPPILPAPEPAEDLDRPDADLDDEDRPPPVWQDMDRDVPLDVELRKDERDFLASAMSEVGGPGRPNEPLAHALGYESLDDLYATTGRYLTALMKRQPLLPWDWRRVLLTAEMVFSSDLFGTGWNWETHTGLDDESSFRVLRDLQDKLIGIAVRAEPPTPDAGA